MGRKWTIEEHEKVKAWRGILTAREIGDKLGRTRMSIMNYMEKMFGPMSRAQKNVLLLKQDKVGPANPNWKGGLQPSKKYAYQKNRIDKNKRRSRNEAFYAYKTGKIERKPCVICGKPQTEMHHPDYTKPLDVVFLCRKHHRQVHSGVIKLTD